ncbi:sugar transferase [Cohnella faecalis]|uniref:Sugar transferase n=1 Tax=Cohnella faecalis TaxID=2315694 RepID=A0A398CXS9_9BACL|nr:sugar transferase [Cohnella faecalis]RIE03794.1 sugar transferase [Cohnella faecalis]
MAEPSKELDFAYGSGTYFPGARTQVNQKGLRFYVGFKRMMDVVIATAALVVLSPFLVIIAAGVKMSDRQGSVFFRQIRIGKNGRPFHMIKFRTMVTNAESMLGDLLNRNEVAGKMFKMKEDPRITKLGKILRKTSVDELPQLINVIRGEMSLVGPRPPLQREVDEYSARDRQRLEVTPGCTGLWQVSGRNALSFDEMVELDLLYISSRSIRMDIRIILKTVKVMIFPNNAY